MGAIEDLKQLDETLSIQLRLALASPLWKALPYGLQVNPRSWQIELLGVRPRRRLCARISVPWRPLNHPDDPPLNFILLLWREDRAPSLHRHLIRYQQRLELPAPGPRRRLVFYDALSHGFVSQVRAAADVQTTSSPTNDIPRWGRRLLRTGLRWLRRS